MFVLDILKKAKSAKNNKELSSELENIDFPFDHPGADNFIKEILIRFQSVNKLHLFSEY